MSKFWIQIEGDKKTQTNIGRIAEAIDRQILEDMALAGAEPVEAAMIGKAPKRLGVLVREIYTRVISRMENDVAVAVGPSSRAFYAKFLVRGTSKMAAKDFMTPVADEQRIVAVRRARAVLWRSLGKAIIR